MYYLSFLLVKSDLNLHVKRQFLQVSNSQMFVDFCQRWTSPPSKSPAKAAPITSPSSSDQAIREHGIKDGSADAVPPTEEGSEEEPTGVVPEYLSKAAEDISQAMKMEAEEDYAGCVDHYR